MFQRAILIVAVSACSSASQLTGSALPLNMLPTAPPAFSGTYDFDLLGAVRGKGCVRAPNGFGGVPTYWVSAAGMGKLAPDAITTAAINAAAFDAINNLKYADTLVITRVVAEPEANDELCAYVYGRGVHLKKAGQPEDEKPTEPDKHNDTKLDE